MRQRFRKFNNVGRAAYKADALNFNEIRFVGLIAVSILDFQEEFFTHMRGTARSGESRIRKHQRCVGNKLQSARNDYIVIFTEDLNLDCFRAGDSKLRIGLGVGSGIWIRRPHAKFNDSVEATGGRRFLARFRTLHKFKALKRST